jgi:DNA-binding NarL/FixJ family response regulator
MSERGEGRGMSERGERIVGTARTVRVLVVDDHPVVRAGLRGMLAADPGIEVIDEASSGERALTLIESDPPDVVLMDLRMPGMDGVTATATITARYPAVRVLVVTTYDRDTDILRAVEAGATGYLLKDTPLGQLVAAIHAAARGETVLAPPVATKLLTQMRAPATDALTPREVEVLSAVAQGLTNAEVGRRLFIGEATVKTHLLRAFAKLGVDDRTAAVTVAMQRGILPPP